MLLNVNQCYIISMFFVITFNCNISYFLDAGPSLITALCVLKRLTCVNIGIVVTIITIIIIIIAIRCTYFIFCCRNKAWTTPDLMDF